MTRPADLILTNATVYTVDAARPWATDIAIADGRILAVGGPDLAHTYRGERTEVRDLQGAFVMPGLVDVHNHHALAGKAALFELTFSVDAGLKEILDAVNARAATLGPDEWIVGGSWGSTLVGVLSHESARRALDAASGGRPVVLGDDSHHNRWANTRALGLAGVGADSVDPEGGVIVRDPGTGAPTGVLLEAAGIAVEKLAREAMAMTEAQHVEASRRGIEILHSFGVTAFQDAAVSLDVLRSLKALDDAGELGAWVVTSMLVNDPIFGFAPVGDALIAQGATFRTTHHRPDFVKIFLDGVPPTRTAAFLDPYLPDNVHGAHFHGSTTVSAQELTDRLRATAAAGLSAKIHCTGDASVRAVLDAVEIVRREGHSGARFQVAHGQFVHPDDVPRFAALDVAADISPFLWTPGVIPTAIAEVRPAELACRMQPNRALLDTGALVAGGSDWPVSESPNAWEGIQGLVTRQDPTGVHPGTLWAEQAITLDEAIAVFTRNGAAAMGIDDMTGSLTPGKSADLVVLNQNPFAVPVTSIIETTVCETWFAGRQVFADLQRPG